MRGAMFVLAALLTASTGLLAADVREDYALLAAHADSSLIRKRTAEGRVLEFVDVLGRKNRCIYRDDGRVSEIRYSTESGDFTTRLKYNKRGELTSIVLADGTIVLFRDGGMRASTGKPSLAEQYAAALEHWLSKNNSGL